MSFLFNFSANVTKNIVQTAISAAIQYAQTCSAQLKSSQSIVLNNCVFKGQSIDVSNLGVGVIKCAQDVSNTAQIQTVVQQALHQAAESASQQLGLLDLGQAAANIGINYSDVEQKLSTTITEQFTQTCTADFASSQSFTCNNSKVFLSEGLYLNNYQSSLVSCTFTAVSSTSDYNNLQQIVSQSAVAKQESLFSFSVVAILVIIAFISIISIAARLGTGTGGTSYASTQAGSESSRASARTGVWIIIGIVIVVALLIIAYTWTASTNGFWPFLPKSNPDSTGYQVSSSTTPS